MASTSITLPVYMRVGNGEEFHLGDFTADGNGNAEFVDGNGAAKYGRTEMAALLRAAADEIEGPPSGEGVDGAAP